MSAPESPPARILLVEDNVNLAGALQIHLKAARFAVQHAQDCTAGLAAVRTGHISLVVLDLMLPGGQSGFDFVKQVRSEGYQVPVLMLTARAAEADKVNGFRLGADDYVTKPFGMLELLARIHALLRRTAASGTAGPDDETAAPVRSGDVEIWPATRSVFRSGQLVRLRPKEYELLLALMRRAGDVVTREELLREIWRYQPGVHSRTLDTHVADLRRKLADGPGSAGRIVTVHTVGYRFVA